MTFAARTIGGGLRVPDVFGAVVAFGTGTPSATNAAPTVPTVSAAGVLSGLHVFAINSSHAISNIASTFATAAVAAGEMPADTISLSLGGPGTGTAPAYYRAAAGIGTYGWIGYPATSGTSFVEFRWSSALNRIVARTVALTGGTWPAQVGGTRVLNASQLIPVSPNFMLYASGSFYEIYNRITGQMVSSIVASAVLAPTTPFISGLNLVITPTSTYILGGLASSSTVHKVDWATGAVTSVGTTSGARTLGSIPYWVPDGVGYIDSATASTALAYRRRAVASEAAVLAGTAQTAYASAVHYMAGSGAASVVPAWHIGTCGLSFNSGVIVTNAASTTFNFTSTVQLYNAAGSIAHTSASTTIAGLAAIGYPVPASDTAVGIIFGISAGTFTATQSGIASPTVGYRKFFFDGTTSSFGTFTSLGTATNLRWLSTGPSGAVCTHLLLDSPTLTNKYTGKILPTPSNPNAFFNQNVWEYTQ